jgi:8-amino-7-oxononanoate synthase
LVSQGVIDWEQLQKALELQKVRPFLHLGEVLCLMGVFTEKELTWRLQSFNREARLGSILMDKRAISIQALNEALERQQADGRPLGAILVELGHLTEQELSRALDEQEGLGGPSADLFDKIGRDRQVGFFRRALERDEYPYFQPLQGPEAPSTRLNGEEIILLAGNSYLGLSDDPAVKEAAIRATLHYGVGTSGSPMLNGTMDLHVALERELCDFMGKEACALFSTGYQTNLGAIGCLVGRGDVVIVDSAAHASIHDGCRLSFGEVKRFNHNNIAHLEQVLKAAGHRGKLVVVDGVYSMDGDMADLTAIVRLAKAYGAKVLLDDAHGFGVLGLHGRGTAEYFGVLDQIDLIMLTFSKSLGTIGGCLLGRNDVIEFIKHRSRAFIFSASLPPGTVAATMASLDRIRQDPMLRQRLERNVAFMRRGLMELGFSLGASHTHILPVHVGDDELALRLGCELMAEGVLVGTVVSPGVPPGQARLRVSIMASHTIDQLKTALEAFERAGTRLGVLHYPLKRGDEMFNLEIHQEKAETVLVLSGDLDTAASMDLDAQLETLVPTVEGNLIVDLGGLTYLNSTGIRSFIRLDKLLKARGSSFKFQAVSHRIYRIFSYCGLDTFFTMERKVEEPIEAAKSELVKVLPVETAAPRVAGKGL